MKDDYESRMKKAFGDSGGDPRGADFARRVDDFMRKEVDLLFFAKMVGGASDPSLEGNQRQRYLKLREFGELLDGLTQDTGKRAVPYVVANMPPSDRSSLINSFIASSFKPLKSTAQHRFELNQAAFARAPVVTVPSGYHEWVVPGLQGLDEIAAMEFGRGRRTS